eukprot:scaffold908_cov333-Prasinococcus_capsulatus_cf.AAC.1
MHAQRELLSIGRGGLKEKQVNSLHNLLNEHTFVKVKVRFVVVRNARLRAPRAVATDRPAPTTRSRPWRARAGLAQVVGASPQRAAEVGAALLAGVGDGAALLQQKGRTLLFHRAEGAAQRAAQRAERAERRTERSAPPRGRVVVDATNASRTAAPPR